MRDDDAFQGIARRYLALVRAALGMELAWVAEHTDGGEIVCAVDGRSDVLDVSGNTRVSCNCVFRGGAREPGASVLIGDVKAHLAATGAGETHWRAVGAYASTAVRLADGRLFGSLSCASAQTHADLSTSDARLIGALATALGEEITVFAARAAARDARRSEIEEVLTGPGLHMVAQPIVRLDTMATVGFEALSRFDASAVRPDRWFSDAAALGVGLPLELTAIRRGLDLLEQMPDDTYVSVNASPHAIGSAELLEALSGVDASRVVIELTEHQSVGDYGALNRALTYIRAAGARVAVDDAGAGYASFRHILNLRPDIIKLDRALISGVSTDSARQALIEALMQFAGGLGAVVVAEGIETAQELACATQLGVSLGQGYFIARPGPVPSLMLA